ncbi:MAG: hypothetical protein ACYTGZ_09895 [Planctomycetota bacterium]|jgi:hypothetical protein
MPRNRARILAALITGLLVGFLATAAGIYAWESKRRATWSERAREIAPRMHAFTRALVDAPENPDPAEDWRPLLKESIAPERMCSLCHDENGERMGLAIKSGALPLDAPRRDLDHDEMVELMESWMRQLNRTGGDLLVKSVVCIDCHRADPRENGPGER